MRRALRSVTLLALAAAIPLLGCGEKPEPSVEGPVVPITTTSPGGGQGNGPGVTTRPGGDDRGVGKPIPDERAVQVTIEKFLTSPDSAEVCGSLLTPRFLRRAYGNLAGCKAARKPATLAVSTQISALRVDRPTARATAKPNGGISNDQRLTFTLSRDDDSWLISNLTSNVRVGP